ncbi:MAG: MotA/TolQ/ExbB proton channel family protein [Rhodoferax sp.]|nr:MotA/TolQ/ExbB proton channel family protein [Rhodoferax sp.]
MFSIIQAAGWPIWPLIASSVLALAIVIERFVSLAEAKIAPPGLAKAVLAATQKRIPASASVANLESGSLQGQVLGSALNALNEQPTLSEDDLRAVVQSAGRAAAQRLDAHLSALATVASAAPLMGLLGTVIGMIEIFGAQGPTGGTGNPAQLAQGISMALYNTAFGLLVAIPALVFWRYFRARVDGYLVTLETSADQLIRHLRNCGHLKP